MKKTYKTPKANVIELKCQHMLLAGSNDVPSTLNYDTKLSADENEEVL